MHAGLNDILTNYDALSLDGISHASLNDRIELKYLVPAGSVSKLLAGFQPEYLALEINGSRQMDYTTRYFDSPDMRLYFDHHNGYANRIKVRQRRYDKTGDCFFEIKRKSGGRTEKSRTAIGQLQDILDASLTGDINYRNINSRNLALVLTNTFTRITLCNRQLNERITIDTAVSVSGNGNSVTLKNVALLEVKQPKLNSQSAVLTALRKDRIHAVSFSKYAIGTALLYPTLKHNNLKPTLLKLNKYGA